MTSAKVTFEDETILFAKYGIFIIDGDLTGAYAWPKNHDMSFMAIWALGQTGWSEYCDATDMPQNKLRFWRALMQDRTLKLVSSVLRISSTMASELQWRLEIESIVYERFKLQRTWDGLPIVCRKKCYTDRLAPQHQQLVYRRTMEVRERSRL
jgi:hypothetical protein